MSPLHSGFGALRRWFVARSPSLPAGRSLYAYWAGEHSDFVRINHGRLRQAGTVSRAEVRLRLVEGQRSASTWQTLSGDHPTDAARLDRAFAELGEALRDAHDDPYLLLDADGTTSERIEAATLPAPDTLTHTITLASEQARATPGALGADLVGFYMAGPRARGLLSTRGHDHYHESSAWSFDFSVYSPESHLRDKAVKSLVAGRDWSAERLLDAVRTSALQVPILARPVHRLPPGDYRAWLAPQACADLVAMFAWGGFSARELATGQSAMGRLQQGQVALDPRVTLREALAEAGAPRFTDAGFLRPDALTLIDAGRFGQALVSPRTAGEFGLTANGATEAESPQALRLAAGDLDPAQAWQRLGTGLSISNLWYLNYSDRSAARVTGMTRFATLWVEDGIPVAPLDPMRFDDSLYALFGERLEALGSQTHWLPDLSSYDWRGFGGTDVPSMLLRALSLTL